MPEDLPDTNAPSANLALALIDRVGIALRINRAIRSTVRSALATSAICLAVAAFSNPAAPGWAAAVAVVVPLVAGLLGWFLPTCGPSQLAARIDAAGDTRDRLSTALALARPATPIESLAAGECGRWIARFECPERFRIRLPREALVLLAPLLSILFLQGKPIFDSRVARTAEPAALDAAERLNALADATPVNHRATELLRNAAGRLASPADTAAGPEHANRELALLADALRSELGAANREALESAAAEALSRDPNTAPAAQELGEGNTPGASDALDQLAAAPKLDPKAVERAREAIREAAKHLSRRDRERATKTAMGATGRDALRQLAEMLRHTNPSENATTESAEALDRLLAAVNSMRTGDGDPPNPFLAQMPADAPGGSGDASESTESLGPGGNPGTEGDDSHSDALIQGTPRDPTALENPARVHAPLGPGESVAENVIARSAPTTAARPFAERYREALASEAGAVMGERIPLASRMIVLNYFDAIRPTSE